MNINKALQLYSISKLQQFKLMLPEKYLGKFIVKFGHEFAESDESMTNSKTRRVDNYGVQVDGRWSVEGTIWEEDADKFYSFLKNFCSTNSIDFQKAIDW